VAIVCQDGRGAFAVDFQAERRQRHLELTQVEQVVAVDVEQFEGHAHLLLNLGWVLRAPGRRPAARIEYLAQVRGESAELEQVELTVAIPVVTRKHTARSRMIHVQAEQLQSLQQLARVQLARGVGVELAEDVAHRVWHMLLGRPL